jgi:hypothetical protein
VGVNFNPQKINLEQVIQKPFVITNKQQLDDLEKHLISNFENKNKWYQLILKEKIDEALTVEYYFYYNLILDLIKSALHQGVNKCIQYIKKKFFKSYRVVSSPSSMAAFKKISEDIKNWDFHRNF